MKTKYTKQLKSLLGNIIDTDDGIAAKSLNVYLIETKLGLMIVISNQTSICLLEFINRKNLTKQVLKIKNHSKQKLIVHKSNLISKLEAELQEYFAGTLDTFKIPLRFCGTVFQQKVWANLQKIPYGQTISYLELAKMSGNEKAFRAAANANANNSIAIVVPCHRVIQSNGEIGGYAGGTPLKKQLLLHEKTNLNKHR